MGCQARINRALSGALRLPLSSRSRYVVISDCHRGEGTANDNFLKNQHLYFAALEYYYERGYTYLELGDGEELWENRCLERIKKCHENVYGMFDLFGQQHRIVRIYGNHNIKLRDRLYEAIILENQEGGRDICMIHGHQADFFNSECWKLSRFLVRYVWKPLERSGVNDPTSAARNYKKLEKYEKCLSEWTKENDTYLAAGHSHRPRLCEMGDLYMNAGSCVHPRCITGIEIEDMNLTLVKWEMTTHPDLSLYVGRDVISGPVRIR